MQQQGKFILFYIDEFLRWLNDSHFNRIVQLIQNHHTYLPDYSAFRGNNHFDMLKGMEDYHVNHNGYSQIAQNLTIFPDGMIAICRPFDTIPAGIMGANQKGLCIENIGNFDIGKDIMTDNHRNAVIKANAALCKKYDFEPSTDTIVYHHWYDLNTGQMVEEGSGCTKTCPGTNFFGGNTKVSAATNFVPLVKQADISGVTSVKARMGEVSAELLNIRSGPGISFDIIGQLAKGVPVQIFEANGSWYRVNALQQQWVFADYILQVN